jgi:proline iminopeptidase
MLAIALGMNQKYQVINFEQRGTGESKNPSRDYSIEGYIADLEAIAKHFGLTRFHIFGHSWGGLYAQIYADSHPERVQSLFLSSPSSGTNNLWKTTENEVLAFNKQHSTPWEFLQMGWYSLLGMMGSDAAYQNLFYLVLTVYNRGHAEIEIDRECLRPVKADPINLTRPNIEKYKPLKKVENPPFPVMMTYGDTDIYGPSKAESISRYPSSKQYEIDTCGHIPWVHNTASFGAILDEFYSLEGSLSPTDPSSGGKVSK